MFFLQMGLEYRWMTMAEGKNGWTTVHVGNAAPVIVVDEKGNEYLGNYDIGKDKASFGWGGKEKVNATDGACPYQSFLRIPAFMCVCSYSTIEIFFFRHSAEERPRRLKCCTKEGSTEHLIRMLLKGFFLFIKIEAGRVSFH